MDRLKSRVGRYASQAFRAGGTRDAGMVRHAHKEVIMIRLLVLTSVILASPSMGQVQGVAPYYATVIRDQAPIHCSDSERFYRVGEMSAGTVVAVDGEGGGWSRILYPAGLSAYVRAMDATVQGDSVTLTQPSRLRAANAAQGYDGSYKALFDSPLPPSTTLRLLETVKDVSGTVAAYKVIAPSGARGYTPTRFLRRATDEEISAYKAKASLPELPPIPLLAPPSPEARPSASGTQPTGGSGTTTSPAPYTPTTPTAPPTGTGDESTRTGTEQTQGNSSGSETSRPTTATAAPVSAYEQLEQAFQLVWKQPVLVAEVDELIVAFDRVIETVPNDRPGMKAQLMARKEALVLRRDLRDRLRALEEQRAASDARRRDVSRQLDEIQKNRAYTIVGELQPSLVYNGKRLPLMFRVVSVGATAPRTLGYLRPSESVRLDDKVGLIVGVVGEATLDPSLKLNIITPIHVDVLRSVTEANKEAAQTPTEK
jgi:hypothetical protein